MRSVRRLLLVTAVCLLIAATPKPAQALGCGPEAGLVLSDGCLFTITGSDTPNPSDGFAVTNADGVPLWDFVSAKNLQAIGYPISQRWTSGPFTFQAFQKVILQWDPGRERMNYYNTLDALANRYPHIELPNVPPHEVLAEDTGADFATVTRNHLAILENNAKIKARFLAEPDWLNLYGLPIRYEAREAAGNPEGLQVLRTQRTVFEIWNVPAPGTTVGRVQLQNIPDKVKRLDNVIIPNAAKAPRAALHAEPAPTAVAEEQAPVTVSPRVSRAIERLDWVADGTTPLEEAMIGRIKTLAATSEELFWHILQRVWVDGIHSPPDHASLSVLQIIIRIANLPWIQDGLAESEHDAFQDVYDAETAALRAINGLNWVQDGLTEIEQSAVEQLNALAATSQDLFLHIVANVWVDGIHSEPSSRDIPVLERLVRIAELSWIQDGFTEAEHETFLQTYDRETGALRYINDLDWLQDGLTPLEETAIAHLEALAEHSPAFLLHVARNVWTDGLHSQPDESNLPGIAILRELAVLPWIADGLSEAELPDVEHLLGQATPAPSVFRPLLQKGWIHDGLSEPEKQVLEDFRRMVTTDLDDVDDSNVEDIARAIIAMPFMNSIEPYDEIATESLYRARLHVFDYFHYIVLHFISTGGITDRDAKIMPAIYQVAVREPRQLEKLLDTSNVMLEERIISLPFSGNMLLSIIRTRPGELKTMRELERSVRVVEEVMTVPFPTNYIALFVSNSVRPAGGLYYGTHIAMQEGYDDGDHYFSNFLEGVLTHEVAHYFWHCCAGWMSEGGAVFVEIRAGILSSSKQQDLAHKCSQTGIQDIADDHSSSCVYFLGARMLHDLYFILGEDLFQVGFRRLYHATQGNEGPDSCENIEIGLCHLRYAFTQGTTPEAAAVAEEFISRWYQSYSARFNIQ